MLSKKSQKIKSFIAMDVLEASQKLEKQGHNIISFGLGEPDFDAPECVKQACIKAIQDNKTKYTHSQGMLELREAICEHYYSKCKVKVHPDQIIVTQGTSPAFFLLFSTILKAGSEVILPNPHYPCDANFVEFMDGKVVYVPIYEKEDYQWSAEKVAKKITKKTEALFVTSPSNPTGTVLSKETLTQLAQLKVPLVSDEIYHGLVYSEEGTLPPAPSPRGRGEGGGGHEKIREHSVLEFTDNAFVVNGFSKAYAMTGFRLGYLIAPQKYVRSFQKIQQNFAISANSFVQIAGITALKEGHNDVELMRKEFARRRLVMMDGLKKLGFQINYNPTGAFYVFVKASHLEKNSLKLAYDILHKAHVSVTPGIDFGKQGEGHLRFSYATSVEKIEEGLSRLRKYLENR